MARYSIWKKNKIQLENNKKEKGSRWIECKKKKRPDQYDTFANVNTIIKLFSVFPPQRGIALNFTQNIVIVTFDVIRFHNYFCKAYEIRNNTQVTEYRRQILPEHMFEFARVLGATTLSWRFTPDNSVYDFARCFVITTDMIRRATQLQRRFKTCRCPKWERQKSFVPVDPPLAEPSGEHVRGTTVKPTNEAGRPRIYRDALTTKRDSNHRPIKQA